MTIELHRERFEIFSAVESMNNLYILLQINRSIIFCGRFPAFPELCDRDKAKAICG